jgi:hypothetical protein
VLGSLVHRIPEIPNPVSRNYLSPTFLLQGFFLSPALRVSCFQGFQCRNARSPCPRNSRSSELDMPKCWLPPNAFGLSRFGLSRCKVSSAPALSHFRYPKCRSDDMDPFHSWPRSTAVIHSQINDPDLFGIFLPKSLDLSSSGFPKSRYPVCRNAPGNTPSPAFGNSRFRTSRIPLHQTSVPTSSRYPKYRNGPSPVEFWGFAFQNFVTPVTLLLWSFESPVSEIPVDSPIFATCPPTNGWSRSFRDFATCEVERLPSMLFRCLNPRNGDLATRVLLPDGWLRFLSLFRDFHCEVPRSLVIRTSEIPNSRNPEIPIFLPCRDFPGFLCSARMWA